MMRHLAQNTMFPRRKICRIRPKMFAPLAILPDCTIKEIFTTYKIHVSMFHLLNFHLLTF